MLSGPRPEWITFDCYGTLVQWDERLRETIQTMLAARAESIDAERLIATYDAHEHAIEQAAPHRRFRDIAAEAFTRALPDLGATTRPGDAATLIAALDRIPPFPEVAAALDALRRAGFRLCIISNTDDALIAGSIAELGDRFDRVVTAEQAGAYKPSPHIFAHAHRTIRATTAEVVHVCASPQLDLVATRELGLRDVWIDRGTGRRLPEGYRPAATLPSLEGLPELFAQAGWH